ncbi:MAG: hypothetical protein AB1589_28660 [Cyanobacteriota bacterium]
MTQAVIIVCAVHPTGPDSDRCLDFRPPAEPEEPEEAWAPERTKFVNGELMPERPIYDGEPVPTPRQRFTPESKLELLDYHPMFTGRCPQCEMPFPKYKTPPIHWDCPQCGWRDDSA